MIEILLGGDIETNPGPTLSEAGKSKVVLSGTVHQGSVQFVGLFSGASSCMTNSVVALAVSQTINIYCWNASIIDGILGI
jgi:hypothetical protein